MASYDITVAGGGIFGLSVARALKDSGLKVLILEERVCGAGASGGLLGALMPHVPDQWNPKKQFQFEALCSLPSYLNALEAETGISTGYARLGRIMPVRNDNDVVFAMAREAESHTRWRTTETGFSFSYRPSERYEAWLSPDAAPLGYIQDTLAARVNPRSYIAALKAAAAHHCDVVEGDGLHSFSDGQVTTHKGDTYASGKLVLAAGYETFPFLAPFTAVKPGSGIKGQSALLRLESPLQKPLPPVIYDDGVYIVPHAPDLCAIGSTSENHWTSAQGTDGALEDLVERARAMSPALRTAEVTDRWAGVRPRARRRDPMLGPVPGTKGLYVATGGFKISFGIAHMVGAIMADILLERPLSHDLPTSFTVEHHFGPSRRG